MMKASLFTPDSESDSKLFFIPGRAYFHSFILSVPSSWSEERCRFTPSQAELPRRGDIVITESRGPGHVQRHNWRGDRDSLVVPMSVVNKRNLTRMMDLWTDYR